MSLLTKKDVLNIALNGLGSEELGSLSPTVRIVFDEILYRVTHNADLRLEAISTALDYDTHLMRHYWDSEVDIQLGNTIRLCRIIHLAKSLIISDIKQIKELLEITTISQHTINRSFTEFLGINPKRLLVRYKSKCKTKKEGLLMLAKQINRHHRLGSGVNVK